MAKLRLYLGLCVLAVVCNLASSSQTWILSAPGHVTAGLAQNVTLRCERQLLEVKNNTTLGKLWWIRISKKEAGGWRNVADIRDLQDSVKKESILSAHGDIQSEGGEFLEVRWDLATRDTFGIYRCDIFGISNNAGFLVEKSPIVNVAENITQESLLEFWDHIREEYNETNFCVEQNGSGHKLIDVKTGEFRHQLGKYFRDVSPLIEISRYYETFIWLHGGHSLPMPSTGCPDGLTGGSSSFIKFHEYHHEGSTCIETDDTDLSKPIRERRSDTDCSVYFRFCESEGTAILDLPWPEGKYCVNKQRNNSCPNGFVRGQVKLDAQDGTNGDKYQVSSSTAWDNSGYTYMDFCCKTTGSADVPILLPTEKPFYMYRYGGTCQEVRGMIVSPQYLDINTQRKGQYDRLTGSHPDIIISQGSPTRIHLCFYSNVNI